jgi:enamine deaminase RidA (YjgF/YER057c/UK114 family)
LHPSDPFLQSQAIKTPNAIYCSGQIPCDAEGTLIEGTIQQKTAACIGNLKAVLEEAGSSIEKVVKVNVFLTDMANFAVSDPELRDNFLGCTLSDYDTEHERGVRQVVCPQARPELRRREAIAKGG